jgi:hypothetical protein
VNATECEREADVLEAVMSGCWPPEARGDDGSEDLGSHASRCAVCAELASVAVVLRTERDDAWREAHVPTSGQIWWRATMRTRAEASAAAGRPITMLQGLAGTCAAGVCAALIVLAWPSTGQPFAGIVATLFRDGEGIGGAALSATLAALMPQALLSLTVVLGAAALILSPFLLYLVVSDE